MRRIASADKRCSRHVHVEPREREHVHTDVQQRVHDDRQPIVRCGNVDGHGRMHRQPVRCDGTREWRAGHLHVEPREREHVHADVQQRVHDIGDRDVYLLSRQPVRQRHVHRYGQVCPSPPLRKDRFTI